MYSTFKDFFRVDADCAAPTKCCFDGCGLKCTNPSRREVSNSREDESRKEIDDSVEVGRSNKRVMNLNSRVSTCPTVSPNAGIEGEECIAECKTSQDCEGLKKCCASGCSRVCLYPQATTGRHSGYRLYFLLKNTFFLECLQQAISHEIFKLKSPLLECDADGNFKEIQCRDDYCYCVDARTGETKPNSRAPFDRHLNCDSRSL